MPTYQVEKNLKVCDLLKVELRFDINKCLQVFFLKDIIIGVNLSKLESGTKSEHPTKCPEFEAKKLTKDQKSPTCSNLEAIKSGICP